MQDLARVFAVAVTVAWTTMFFRVIVEVAVVNRALLYHLWVPMAAAGGAGLAYALFLYLRQRGAEEEAMEFKNPFELGPALTFGLLYAVILLVSRLAQIWLGNQGGLSLGGARRPHRRRRHHPVDGRAEPTREIRLRNAGPRRRSRAP